MYSTYIPDALKPIAKEKTKARRSKRMMMKIPPDMFCFGNPILISITELSRRENLNADVSARRKNGNYPLRRRENSFMDYSRNDRTDGRRRCCRCLNHSMAIIATENLNIRWESFSTATAKSQRCIIIPAHMRKFSTVWAFR